MSTSNMETSDFGELIARGKYMMMRPDLSSTGKRP